MWQEMSALISATNREFSIATLEYIPVFEKETPLKMQKTASTVLFCSLILK